MSFRFRSASVPSQVIDVLIAQNGRPVQLLPLSATPDQQRWVFDGIRMRHITQQNLCMQPETAARGARVVVRTCDTGEYTLQRWVGLKLTNGRIQLASVITDLYIDASAGAFGTLRMQPRSATSLAQQFTME